MNVKGAHSRAAPVVFHGRVLCDDIALTSRLQCNMLGRIDYDVSQILQHVVGLMDLR